MPRTRRKTRKLVDLEIDETSGVDHPAHLHEGWLVMKGLDVAVADANEAALSTDQGEAPVELTTTDDTPVEDQVDEAPEVEETVIDEATPVVAAATPDEDPADVRKEMEDLRKALQIEREARETLERQRLLDEAVERVGKWQAIPGVKPDEVAPVLCVLREAAPEATERIEAILDGAAVSLSEAGVLKEVGTDAEPSTDDAWTQIQNLATSLVEAGSAGSMAKAVEMVARDNPDLYVTYRNERK